MNKKVIVVPGNTDLNRGDQSLVWESMNMVSDAVGPCTFSLLESGTSKEDIDLQSRQTRNLGVEILPKILKHPRRISERFFNKSVKYSGINYVLWGIQAVFDLFYTALQLSSFGLVRKIGRLLLSKEEAYTLETFKNCDAVVVKGGGFIHGYGKITDFYTLYFSLYHTLLAIRYNKRVIIFPNSIGPVTTSWSRKLVKHVLNNCQLLTLRESVSVDYLQNSMQIKGDLYPDLGFYLQPKKEFDSLAYLKSKNVPTDKKLIGITLRPYRFPKSPDPDARYAQYLEEIKVFVQDRIQKQYHVVLFAHTLGPSSHEDDRIALKALQGHLTKTDLEAVSYIEDFDLDARDMMMLYANLEVLVGTRFHSVIFALNQNIPCLAIAYGGNKTYGIMEEMGLESFVFPIEGFSGKEMIQKMQQIEDNKEAYKNKIADYRVYLEKARQELQDKVMEVLR